MLKRIAKKLVSVTMLMAFLSIAFHGLIHDHSQGKCNSKLEKESHAHTCGHDHSKDLKVKGLHLHVDHDCSICQYLSKLQVELPNEPDISLAIHFVEDRFSPAINNKLLHYFYSPTARGPPAIISS